MALKDRLRRLEERVGSPDQQPHTEDRERERWFLRARQLQRDALSERDADHARSLIRLFRTQGLLSGMNTGELADRVLAWCPLPEGGRSPGAVEREVALAIYRGEPGTEHMVCPARWCESFAAGDELRERYEAVPDEELAGAYAHLLRIEKGDEAGFEEWDARFRYDLLGATDELGAAAVGPDFGEVSEEERDRRIAGALADATYGEKGYRVWQCLKQAAGATPIEEV